MPANWDKDPIHNKINQFNKANASAQKPHNMSFDQANCPQLNTSIMKNNQARNNSRSKLMEMKKLIWLSNIPSSSYHSDQRNNSSLGMRNRIQTSRQIIVGSCIIKQRGYKLNIFNSNPKSNVR